MIDNIDHNVYYVSSRKNNCVYSFANEAKRKKRRWERKEKKLI